jgi:hypothetical protein
MILVKVDSKTLMRRKKRINLQQKETEKCWPNLQRVTETGMVVNNLKVTSKEDMDSIRAIIFNRIKGIK